MFSTVALDYDAAEDRLMPTGHVSESIYCRSQQDQYIEDTFGKRFTGLRRRLGIATYYSLPYTKYIMLWHAQ